MVIKGYSDTGGMLCKSDKPSIIIIIYSDTEDLDTATPEEQIPEIPEIPQIPQIPEIPLVTAMAN